MRPVHKIGPLAARSPPLGPEPNSQRPGRRNGPPQRLLSRPPRPENSPLAARAFLVVGYDPTALRHPRGIKTRQPAAPTRNPSSFSASPVFLGPDRRRRRRRSCCRAVRSGRRRHGRAVVARPRAQSFSPPLLSLAFAPSRGGHEPRRPWMAGEGGGGAAVAPLAGARVRPEPRAAPLSGTSVVPFGGPVRARSEVAARFSLATAVVRRRSGASGAFPGGHGRR